MRNHYTVVIFYKAQSSLLGDEHLCKLQQSDTKGSLVCMTSLRK